MEYHYGKHHAAYIANLNTLQQQAAEALLKGDTQGLTAISQAIKFNGGGHHNHEFFWESLAPTGTGKGGDLPSADSLLYSKIVSTWGSFDNFII